LPRKPENADVDPLRFSHCDPSFSDVGIVVGKFAPQWGESISEEAFSNSDFY
jgi:hypothetical protein